MGYEIDLASVTMCNVWMDIYDVRLTGTQHGRSEGLAPKGGSSVASLDSAGVSTL